MSEDVPIITSSHVNSIDVDGVQPRILKVGPRYVLMVSGSTITEFIPIGGIEGIYYSGTDVYLKAINTTNELGDGLRFEWQDHEDNEHSLTDTLKIVCQLYGDITGGMKLQVAKGSDQLMIPTRRYPDHEIVRQRFIQFLNGEMATNSEYDDDDQTDDTEKENIPIITSSVVYSIEVDGTSYRRILRVGPKFIFMVEQGDVTEYVLIKDLDRNGCFWLDQQAVLNIKPSRKRNNSRTMSACRERGLFFEWADEKSNTRGLVETLKIISECYKGITGKSLRFYKGREDDMYPKVKMPDPNSVAMSLALVLEGVNEHETIGEWFVRQDIFKKKPSLSAAKYLASKAPAPALALHRLKMHPYRAPPLQGKHPPRSLIDLRLRLGDRFEQLLDSPEDLTETVSLANKLALSGALELVCQPLKERHPDIPYEHITSNYVQVIKDHVLRSNANPTARYLNRVRDEIIPRGRSKLVAEAFETLRNPKNTKSAFREAASYL